MVKTHDSVLTNIKYMRKYAGKLLPYSRVQLTEVGFESMLWGLSVFPVSQKSRKVLCNLSTYPNRRSWTNKTFFLVAPLLEMWHEKNRKQYRLCSWIWEGFWNMCLSLFFYSTNKIFEMLFVCHFFCFFTFHLHLKALNNLLTEWPLPLFYMEIVCSKIHLKICQ